MKIQVFCEECDSKMLMNPFAIFKCKKCGAEEKNKKMWFLLNWGTQIIDEKFKNNMADENNKLLTKKL